MTKPLNILTTLFTILILYSCGNFEPEVEFSEPINGRMINLSNNVGDSFQIIRDVDTIEYTLSFDKVTKYNYLIKYVTDTVFVGTVTKRNELFLLNRPLNNGKFSIHVLKFTDSTIIGLETEWLQSAIINNELDSGKYANLIIDTVKVNTLKANKKDGKEIFRYVIEQLEPEKILFNELDNLSNVIEQDATMEYVDNSDYKKGGLIKKVFPNPFEDQVTIELIHKSLFIFMVFDLNGKLIMNSKQNTDKIKIELPNLKTGTYILQVRNDVSKVVDEKKLVKK